MRMGFTAMVLAGMGVLPIMAQMQQPAPVLEITRESIKEGRSAAHEKVELEWAAALRKANFPQTYVGLDAISGPSVAWFIEPAPSFAKTEEWQKIGNKEPLKSTIAMLDARDGELRSGSTSLWAVYNKELSYKPEKFDRAKIRYVSAGVYRVKLGHDEDFTSAAKKIFEAYDRGNVDLCLLGYQVVAGAPAGTYILFNVMQSMQPMDEAPARSQALRNAMGAEEFSRLMRSSGDVFTSMETTLLRVNPMLSYATKEMIDADPGFWKPKVAAPKPAAPAATEKKGAQ
jgi:hypothetical protein